MSEINLYAIDAAGKRIYPGDHVSCEVGFYESIRRGEIRKVEGIEDGNIVMKNGLSPHGTSPYRSYNFALKTTHKQEKPTMIHLAMLIQPDHTPTAVVRYIETDMPLMMADVSPDALKAKVRARVKSNPNERWLILSGSTIAELDVPPVTFRQW